MKSKSFLYSMAAIVAMGLATSSCSNDMDEPMSLQTRAVVANAGNMSFEEAQTAGYGAKEFNFVSGRNETEVGSIQVWNDDTNLYVKFNITDEDYAMTETHLYVGTSDEFFNGKYIKNGNIHPGQLPYKNAYDEAVMEDTYTILLEELYAKYGLTFGEDESEICPLIAAHAAAANGESISIQSVKADESAQLTTRGKGNNKDKGDKGNNNGGNWFMYVDGDYCVEFPDSEEEEPGDEDKEYTWSISGSESTTVANADDHETMFKKGWFTRIDLSDVILPYTADLVSGNENNSGQDKTVGQITIKENPENTDELIIDFSDMWIEEGIEVTMEDNGKCVVNPDAKFIIAGFEEDPAGKYQNQGNNTMPGRDEITAAQTITVDKKKYYYIHLHTGKLVVTEVSEAAE